MTIMPITPITKGMINKQRIIDIMIISEIPRLISTPLL
jgi:hypothetical protein